MPINATCQQCGATLPVPDEFAGKSVRCGGCQGVVRVPTESAAAAPAAPAPPATAVPVAKSLRPRPVAVPVAARERPAAKAEVPIPKARKARDDEDPEDVPKTRTASRRRPIAKRRRDSILTPTALKWLTLFVVTGTVGLGVLGYAAWGASRKNDGTAYVPPEDNPPPAPPAAVPPPAPLRWDAPGQGRIGNDPPLRVDNFDPNPVPPVAEQPPAVPVPPRVADLPFKAGTNAVLITQAGKYDVTASSQFDAHTWTAAKAFDNNTSTSWYSRAEGNLAKPWVQVTFRTPVAVSRVVVLGNRDQFGNTYTVQAGTLTLLDGNNRELFKAEKLGVGPKSDFEFGVGQPRVHAVRFTATASTNAGMCVAIGELQVE